MTSAVSRQQWSSSYPVLHSSENVALRTALSSLDGYGGRRDRLDQISGSLDELLAQPKAQAQRREQIVSDLIAGEQMPETAQLLGQAADLLAGERETQEARNLLIAAGTRVVEHLDQDLERGAEALLTELDSRLQTMLEAARSGRVYTGTAEQAITGDCVEDYEQTQAWLGEHKTIRSAQRLLVRWLGSGERIVDQMLPALFMRNVLDVFPTYGEWCIETPFNAELQPYPRLGLESEQLDVLVWLVEHPEAGAWVPTLRQLQTEQERLSHQAAAYDRSRYERVRESV